MRDGAGSDVAPVVHTVLASGRIGRHSVHVPSGATASGWHLEALDTPLGLEPGATGGVGVEQCVQ